MLYTLCTNRRKARRPSGGAFVDACVLQHLHEDCADLLPQDFFCVFRRERVPRLQLLRPARVLLQRLVGAQVAVLQDRVCQKRKLSVQPGRQDGEAHDLDQADVLLLDVVQRLVRMVQAQRMLRRGEVIAQDEVKLKRIFPAAGDGRDGVVRNAVRFDEDHGGFVRIAAPRGKGFYPPVHTAGQGLSRSGAARTWAI